MSTTEEILNRLQEILKTAELGFKDLIQGPPPRKLPGLRNLIVFGRSITNILQKLRSTEPGFDEWYLKYRTEMEEDQLMKYFYNLRSDILKEGIDKVNKRTHITKLKLPDDYIRFGPPPPNATGFFIGGEGGGNGWIVRLPDGSEVIYYFELPSDIGSTKLVLQEPPQYHLGKRVPDSSIETLCGLYIEYLRQLVNEAKIKFGPKK